MDAGGEVFTIAVSQDGNWIVSGTEPGLVTVWNTESHEKVNEFTGHSDMVGAVDVSPDGTRIATGSKDNTAFVWLPSTGERLVWLKHDHWVAAVKFSPDGYLIATATWNTHSVRIYGSQDGRLLFDVPIQPVGSTLNGSLAWSRDSKQLFALSHDGNIIRLDASTGDTLSTWPIHKSNNPRCISLASNGMFIAASSDSSVSFWNTTTREQIGPVIKHTHDIWSMALSANYDLVVGGEMTITLRRLYDILPSSPFRYPGRWWPTCSFSRVQVPQ
ncbi:WD40 repeat-like protein [Imleria badia]|nr:WD40 repeat-like protein [Imleria badia]